MTKDEIENFIKIALTSSIQLIVNEIVDKTSFEKVQAFRVDIIIPEILGKFVAHEINLLAQAGVHQNICVNNFLDFYLDNYEKYHDEFLDKFKESLDTNHGKNIYEFPGAKK